MCLAIIVILLCTTLFFAYQWGVTAVREHGNGYEKGFFEYQNRVRGFANAHPTLTAEELYETLKINIPDEESRQN
jgi:hypothetical protein